MTTFLALLRGINVGGRNTIPMAELRALCGAAGYRDVQSHIQSGNLVFTGAETASSVEGRLEASIAKRFGIEVEVIVRTAAQWPAYLKGNPFPEASREDPAHVLLALSKSPPKPRRASAARPCSCSTPSPMAPPRASTSASAGCAWVRSPATPSCRSAGCAARRCTTATSAAGERRLP